MPLFVSWRQEDSPETLLVPLFLLERNNLSEECEELSVFFVFSMYYFVSFFLPFLVLRYVANLRNSSSVVDYMLFCTGLSITLPCYTFLSFSTRPSSLSSCQLFLWRVVAIPTNAIIAAADATAASASLYLSLLVTGLSTAAVALSSKFFIRVLALLASPN